jgi:GNAT superfamily N-acetyltransferase
MTSKQPVLDSTERFIDAWTWWSKRSPAGEVGQACPGVVLTWANHSWPICNLMFFDHEVSGEADFTRRLESSIGVARGRKYGWLLCLSPDMLPEGLRDRATEIRERYGLVPVVSMTGMVTGELAPPRRPLPQLEFRRVRAEDTRKEVARINAVAYQIPLAWGDEALDHPAMWGGGSHGYVAYVDGKPVSTATVLLLEQCHYVGLVATLPELQRRGYAEAVMRHAMAQAQEEAGPKQTVLHATAAGEPLYRAMGFHPITPFVGYCLQPG